jgi:beta-glucosidase
MRSDETTIISIDVTNMGDRLGDEVVQFYVHDLLSDRVTRPVKLLKGFERITLKPGECRTVTFTVGREQLEYLDDSMRRIVEPGQFELMVGGSSKTLKSILLEVA